MLSNHNTPFINELYKDYRDNSKNEYTTPKKIKITHTSSVRILDLDSRNERNLDLDSALALLNLSPLKLKEKIKKSKSFFCVMIYLD